MAGLALGALLASWLVVAPVDVHAGAEYVDLTGQDACETAISMSVAGFDPGVEGVVISSGSDHVAAVSSTVLAAAYDGPLLLTAPDSFDPRVRDEIWRLGPDWIFLVGTSAGVASDVAKAFPELAASGRVVLLCGSDTSETTLLVARQVGHRNVGTRGVVLFSEERASTSMGTVVVASAVAAGKSWPMLFVPDSGLLAGAAGEVLTELRPAEVLAIGTSVEVEGAAEVTRLEDGGTYELGARIAEFASAAGSSYEHAAVICAAEGPMEHGLAVGAYLAGTRGVAVLTSADDVPSATIRLAARMGQESSRVDFCGALAKARLRMQLLLETAGLPEGFGIGTLERGSESGEVAWLEQRLADLSYRPGPIDGVYDSRTRQAVIAFQKWEGLGRDGVVGSEVWWRLLGAERPVPAYAEEGKKNAPQGRWIEVDKERQVLLYCVEGEVERILAVSTGSARVGVATPSGMFFVRRENSYERVRYKPLYLSNTTLLAIHGYTSVPTYPASHGCVRMTWTDMDEFHDLIPLGTPVLVY